MRKTPIKRSVFCSGVFLIWRVRSDVPTLWLPTALTKCIDQSLYSLYLIDTAPLPRVEPPQIFTIARLRQHTHSL